MKLSDVKKGRAVKIISIKSDLKKRLSSFGIIDNAKLKMEKNQGGVIVSLNGRLIALSKIIADNVEVEICE